MSSSKASRFLRPAALLLAALMLVLCAAGCTKAETKEAELLAYDAAGTQQTSGSKLRTAAAEVGHLEMWTPGLIAARLNFATDVRVTCMGYAGMSLVELKVSDGNYVEAGQVLAVFEPVYDPQTIAELKDELTILQLQYAADLFSYDQAVENARTALASATEADRELRQIELTLAQNEWDRFVSENSGRINSLTAQIAVMEGPVQQKTLVAPTEGYITDLLYLSDTSTIENTTQLCRICSKDNVYLTIINSKGDKAYRENNKVSISVAGTLLCYGTVISANSATGLVAIQPDEVKDFDTLGNGKKTVTVYGLRYSVEDVLYVPTSALKTDGAGTYVSVVRDGTTHKRYVQIGIEGTSDAGVEVTQILEGIQAGDLVAVG